MMDNSRTPDSAVSSGGRGRLPPLRLIGRSHGVDMPTPIECDAYSLSGLQPDRRGEYSYHDNHGPQTAAMLDGRFYTMEPGAHCCRRTVSRGHTFTHCPQAVDIASRYAELRQLLENRAKLELVRDYTSRIHSMQNFVNDVKGLVVEEYSTWYNVMHSCVSESPTTKLEYLNVICDDLRIHSKHWNSVKQSFHNNKWLKQERASLVAEMNRVCCILGKLRDSALWWLDKLIKVGLQVLAHSDPEQLTHEVLWNITRGLEEYNAIVTSLKLENPKFSKCCLYKECGKPQLVMSSWRCGDVSSSTDPLLISSLRFLGESVRPMPFLRLLNILANERSKYPAMMTQRFLTESPEFLEMIRKNKLPDYVWENKKSEGKLAAEKDKRENAWRNTQTSDYHTASTTSLSAAMLQVGSITAPDLSSDMSPVIDFSRREHEFSSRFLQIVCHSTGLLKRTASDAKKKHLSRTGVPPRVSNGLAAHQHASFEDESRSLNDSGRKTVWWRDAYDVSLRQQLTDRYMELLWQNFGNNLWTFFQEHAWGTREAGRDKLGHLLLCPDTVLMLVTRMMQQLCAKDMFPSEGVLSQLIVRMHTKASWQAWDKGICSALASANTDKCYATPLVDNNYCTKTARLIRDSYRPLMSILGTLQDSLNSQVKGGGATAGGRGGQGSLMTATVQKVLVSCRLATSWCQHKGAQFLNAWSVRAFLLVTQSDLRLIADENQNILTLSRNMCDQRNHGSRLTDARVVTMLDALWRDVDNSHSQMQSKSSSLLKQFAVKCHQIALEFFQDAMPIGKVWRKRSSQELPCEHNAYAEQAMDTLLDPVMEGVGKLKPTAQMAILSLTITEICYAWTAHILKQKIHFSLHGAYQLQCDFDYIRTWLDSFVSDVEVRQSVMALDVFRYLKAIVDVLKRQPQEGAGIAWPDRSMCCEVTVTGSEQSLGSLDDTLAARQVEPPTSSLSSCQHVYADSYKLTNVDQWLALRVCGGSRSWKLPTCFNASVTRN